MGGRWNYGNGEIDEGLQIRSYAAGEGCKSGYSCNAESLHIARTEWRVKRLPGSTFKCQPSPCSTPFSTLVRMSGDSFACCLRESTREGSSQE